MEINALPNSHKTLAKKYLAIRVSETFSFSIVDTFIILYLLQFLSFAELGIALAARYTIVSVLDLPTGAIGDFIGQGRVLRIAYIFMSSGAFVLIFANSLELVLISWSLYAIGLSQLSGALDSWFDNYYKQTGIDTEKQIYGSFKGRLRGITIVVSGTSFILAGIIAQIYSRQLLVIIHFVSLIMTMLLIFYLIDLLEQDGSSLFTDLYKNTKNKIKQSLIWFYYDKQILFTFLGTAMIFGVGGGIWYNQILFPYYFAYAGSDFFTGIIRSLNFLIGLIWILFVPMISKRVTDERIPFILSIAYANAIFFAITLLYWLMVPPAYRFELIPFIGVIIIFQAVGIGDVLTEVFLSRIMIKKVPEDIRNSIYSVFATLITLFSIPSAILGGYVIDKFGLSWGIVVTVIISSLGTLLIALGLIKYDYKPLEEDVIADEILENDNNISFKTDINE